MRLSLRSILHRVALSGGFLALMALGACTPEAETDATNATDTVESGTGEDAVDGVDGSDDTGPGDVGDGTESLDADGFLGDSTSADGGVSDDVRSE